MLISILPFFTERQHYFQGNKMNEQELNEHRGKQDQSFSGESIGRLRKLIPGIEYYELDGAAHLAHYEFPDRINPLLVDFFKR